MSMTSRNKQRIMEKFTKLAGASCYDIDVKVEFCCLETTGFKFHSGECDKVDGQVIIRYNETEFTADEMCETSWYLLLHEITHVKYLGHTREFWDELAVNFERTMELRKQFYNETGFEDSYNDLDYEEYFDEDNTPPEDAIIDEENLEWEDLYFETYNIFKEND